MLKNEKRDLKNRINEKIAKVDTFVESKGVQVHDDNVWIDPEGFAEAKQDYNDIAEMKAIMDMASIGTKMRSSFDLDPESESLALASTGALGGEAKSIGEWFVNSPEFKQLRDRGQVTMEKAFEMNTSDFSSGGIRQATEQKDVYATMNPATFTRQLGSIQFDPMVPRAYRKTRVRDLFPVATTSSNLIDFFVVVGYASTNQGAKAVPDRNTGNTGFQEKPHTNLVVRANQAPVRTLAHWEAAHRNVLDDVPQLQSLINNELLYGIQLEEDRQILQGAGDSQQELLGIMNTPDVQTFTAGASEINSDAIRRAITRVVLSNYDASGVVLHPIDWETTELQKGRIGSSAGDGQYMLVTNVSVGANQTIWRQPVVESHAIPQGKFLTGAFGTGFQLYDRQQANIRTSEHHGNNFITNSVTVLAESRCALAGKRPESMVVGTLASSGT